MIPHILEEMSIFQYLVMCGIVCENVQCELNPQEIGTGARAR